jgi:hypothetical protein
MTAGRRILRYQLALTSEPQTVHAPRGPVLDVEMTTLDNGVGVPALDVWIEGAGAGGSRTFQVLGTGAYVPDGAWHSGSAARHDGFKWHVYELREW